MNVITRSRETALLRGLAMLLCLAGMAAGTACARPAPAPSPTPTPQPTTPAPTLTPVVPAPTPPPTVTTTSLPAGRVGATYSAPLAASGGTPPYGWTVVSGTLPPGLTLKPIGVITGTPSAAGTFNFALQASDSSVPTLTSQAALSIAVALPPLGIATTSLPVMRPGTAYSLLMVASGGTLPYTWSIVGGSLPPGLDLSATGLISGAPSAIGTFNFTVQVADGGTPALTTRATLSIIVELPSLSVTSTLPLGNAGIGYAATLAASGGRPPYNWSLVSGALPPGLSLNAAGTISGTPTSVGAFTFTLQVADGTAPALTALWTSTITITSFTPTPLNIVTSSLPQARLAASYSASLVASGGNPPYSWSLRSGSLPAGLALSVTGTISGIPLSSGTFNFTVRVTDSSAAGLSVNRPLVLTVVF